jgi:WD40 repeat protein
VRLLAVLSFFSLLAGCGQTDSPSGGATPTGNGARPLRIEPGPGSYNSATWLSSGWIVFSYEATVGDRDFVPEIFQVRPDGTNLRKINLPDNPTCRDTEYRSPNALPDGRVGLTQTCGVAIGTGPSAKYTIVAYDLVSRSLETLVPLQDMIHPGAASWNQNLTRAIGAQSSGICSSIAWLTRTGPEYLTIEIRDGARHWRLDQEFTEGLSADCSSQGRASLPSWSPDGATIAFMASPASIGLSGQARLGAPWQLYLLDPESLAMRKVLDQIRGPSNLAWFPDGKWLAFSATISGKGAGTWLFSPSSRELRALNQTVAESLASSPNGRQLIALIDDNSPNYPVRNHLALMEVGG